MLNAIPTCTWTCACLLSLSACTDAWISYPFLVLYWLAAMHLHQVMQTPINHGKQSEPLWMWCAPSILPLRPQTNNLLQQGSPLWSSHLVEMFQFVLTMSHCWNFPLLFCCPSAGTGKRDRMYTNKTPARAPARCATCATCAPPTVAALLPARTADCARISCASKT